MVENNYAKLIIQPPKVESKLKIRFLTMVALLIKEVGFLAVVSWLGGINPSIILDGFFGSPTLIIVCSCHLMDAENNFKASFFEAILLLITICV